jgi:UDP-GlcNAc:undecaprenyl-phosphate GlcNAc-1-phosphate transferase
LMSNFYYLAYFIFLFVMALVYFRVARSRNIVDLPNHRTMHMGATIRGGGIVVLVGVLVFSLLFHNPGFIFLSGLVLIGITGFADDLVDLSRGLRIATQLISIVLIFLQLELMYLPPGWLVFSVLVATGILNAFNFMDGINGVTVGYSLVFVSTLIYVHYNVQSFVEVEFLYGYFLALFVFGFFNFRRKAVCFAGDVGSLTIAFINVFLLLKLMVAAQSVVFIFLFTIYGIDTIYTIVERIFRRENIFEAHRSHLFQVIVRKARVSHLSMTAIYMLSQAIVNLLIIEVLPLSAKTQTIAVGGGVLMLSIAYLWVKFRLIDSNL